MKLTTKLLLTLEVILGFGLVFYFWAMSLAMSWIFVIGAVQGDKFSILAISSVVIGSFGVRGVYLLVKKIMNPESQKIEAMKLKICLALGLIAILIASHIMGGLDDQGMILNPIILVPPLIAALHLVYLGRSYLWFSS